MIATKQIVQPILIKQHLIAKLENSYENELF